MERKQKTEQDTCQRKDRAKPEGYEGGLTYLWMNEKGNTSTSDYKPKFHRQVTSFSVTTTAKFVVLIKKPPNTERYVRWCERSENKI